MKNKRAIIYTGAIAGLAGCMGDIISFFVFASRYKGYNPVNQALSDMGSSVSPISGIVSFWWILFGILIIVYAFGFNAAYSRYGRFAKISTWLIIFYGIGEGIGSGLFKFDIVNNAKTLSYSIHEVFGSIGVFGIILLPFAVLKIDKFTAGRSFARLTRLVIIFGLIFFVLFSIRYVNLTNIITDFINRFTGLWQRLFLVTYYIFLITISIRMLRELNLSKDA